MSLRLGYFYGIAAYLCWGAFPLFFALLTEVDPFEVVPWRVLTALAFCLVAVTVMRGWGAVSAIMRSPRALGWFVVSAVLLYANWQVFVVGVVTGHVIETSLGYFINPIVTILIGVVVRKERLSPTQWTAVGIASAGVLVSAISYGQFPYIALCLAFTFALYGAVRKQASEDVDALTGLTVETLLGSVLAVAQLGVIFVLAGQLSAFDHGPAVTIPLLLSGVITAVPLLLFGAGNRRLPLSRMGFVQFTTPILSFLTGYLIFNEPMSPVRWIGFIAVWIALIVLIVDMVRALRASGRERMETVGGPPASEPGAAARTSEIPVQPSP